MNNYTNSLSISGGGTKFIGIFGMMQPILEKWSPDIVTATSAGALFAPLIRIIDWKDPNDPIKHQCLELFSRLQPSDIWDVKPVNSRGKITFAGALRAVTEYPSMGSMKNLEKMYRKIVTEELFTDHVMDEISIFVNSVDYNTGAIYRKDISKVGYNKAIKLIMASSSIPVYAEPYNNYGSYLFDGGVREHNAGRWLIDSFAPVNHLSIYTRPQDYNITIEDWKPSNVLEVLSRTIEIQSMEISKKDEQLEKDMARFRGTKLTQLFMPAIMKNVYDLDQDRLYELYEQSYQIGKEYADSSL